MSPSLTKGESSSGKNPNRSIKGSEEGKEYEKITLVLLAERGYELSEDNTFQFRNFSIGREVRIGEDSKLDDIVLRYDDRDSTKNLIFVQIKHKQDDSIKINSQVLFGSGCGNMGRDFKLRKYFISYLNIREGLQKSKELENGKISYIAIFTNIGVDEMELKNKGISLKEAPGDIKTLFALKKSSFERREASHCYQLCIDDNVRDDLTSTFKKYADSNRIEKDLSQAENLEKDLPDQWIKDIGDFFKCFVLFVNQPNVTDLLKEIYPKTEIFLQGTPVGEAIEKLHQKFRERIEKTLGIYKKNSNEEVWLSGEQIIQFVQELQDAIHTCVMTFSYEDDVMNYGSFRIIGKLASSLGIFLNDKWNKVFCVCTPTTLITTLKVLQYLHKKKYGERCGQISLKLNDLKKISSRVEKAFRSENNKLLIIECRHTVNEQSVDELCHNYSGIIKESNDKKIIVICKQNESTLAEKFRFYLKELFQSDCDPENLYVQQTDDVNLKDFVPVKNPIDKEVIVFQEQKVKINLARLTGFEDWENYVDYLSDSIILNTTDISDIMIQILNNDQIEVGNKALGTSSLEGAYATLSEEINLDTLSNKLLSKEVGNVSLCDDNLEKTLLTSFKEVNSHTLEQNLDKHANEIYIFDGIKGSNNKEKIAKLTKYLRLVNEQEEIENQFGSIGSDSKIQITNDQFTDESFKQICHIYPNKKIFWIYVKYEKNELKFILQELYNPNFYLKRKFKFFEKVVISKKRVKEQLILKHLSEIFIFHCIFDRQEFTDSLQFNVCELKQFQINSERGKIKLSEQEDDVEAIFHENCRPNETVHWLKFENEQIIWWKSHGSLDNLRMYIDKDASEITVKEDDLIKEIQDKKFVIISDDPGMGKTTTLTKLYESENNPVSFTETHWIIRIDLKDHLQAIRDIKLINGLMNVVSVVAFLSKVEAKLNNNLSKSLLEITLDRNKHFSIELLLVFDGFDEVLDEGDRSKVISLLKFLKEDTPAKIWITTRLHYKEILENELSLFSIEFVPLDDDDKVAYIKKYLKDRLELILESKVFTELFANNDDEKENERLQDYTNAFLNKMKSVFKENIFRFIGTPLQLYLMLEGSTKHFKTWIENDFKEIPNFNYLGKNLLEIYEKFIDRKYDIYFKKMDIKESISQEKDKFIFDQFNKDVAKSLILNSKLKMSLEKFKYTVLSAGIIKSNGSNIEFIHTTFRDYFSAMVFVHWIKKVPNELSRTNKQEYILKEIFKKPDYRLIRTFINFKLKKIEEPVLLGGSLSHYGIIAKQLLIEEQSPTILHIAVEECNSNIAYFLLNCLKVHSNVLEKFLLKRSAIMNTVLHLACSKENGDLITILLDAAARISENTKKHKNVLMELLVMRNLYGDTALHLACRDCSGELVRILLNGISRKTKGHKGILKKFLFMGDETKKTALHLACIRGNGELIRILLNAAAKISDCTKGHKSVLEEFLFMRDDDGNTALHSACKEDHIESVRVLLETAVGISEDTLQKLIFSLNIQKRNALDATIIRSENVLILKELLKRANNKLDLIVNNEKKFNSLCLAYQRGNEEFVTTLLEEFKYDDNSLKQLLFRHGTGNALYSCIFRLPADLYSSVIVECFLSTAKSINDNNEILKNLLLPEDLDYRPLNEAVAKGNIFVVKMILSFAKDIDDGNYTLKRLLYNSTTQESTLVISTKDWRCNTLHIACSIYGNIEVIKVLIYYAISINDGGKTVKELVTSTNINNFTAFELLKNGYTDEIKQVVESFITEAKINNDEDVVNVLQEINMKYAGLHSPLQ